MSEISYMKTSFGEYPIIFSLSTLRMIEEKYGTYHNWVKNISSGKEENLGDLTYCLTQMINSGFAKKAFGTHQEPEEIKQFEAEIILEDYGVEKGMELMFEKIKEAAPNVSKKAKAAGIPKKPISRG